MPLVACPKCSTNLRIPDGATGAVRCPKCQTVFQPPRSQPAFEVIDDAPPPRPTLPPPRPATAPPKSAAPARPAPPPKPAASQPFDFDPVEDDEPRKPKRRVTARDDDDDDDDRPRSRGRRRDDDDDDYDDRPRKKKRRDDDDDYDDRPAGPAAGAGAAKVGMLMLSISLWIQLGMFALLALFVFVGWLGGFIPLGLMVFPAMLGLASTILSGIGLGFSIAGPPRARGLAIAATAVAGVHLILSFVVATNTDAGLFSNRSNQKAAIYAKISRIMRLAESIERGKEPSSAQIKQIEEEGKRFETFAKENKEDIEAVAYYEAKLEASRKNKDDDFRQLFRSSQEAAPSGIRWMDVASLLPFLDQFLSVTAYHNKFFGDYILGLLGGLAELARLILSVLLIGSLSKAVRGGDAAGKAKIGLIGVCIAAGVSILVALVITATVESAKKDAEKAMENTTLSPKERGQKLRGPISTTATAEGMGRTLIFGLYAGMMLMPAIAALQASSEAGRRARKR